MELSDYAKAAKVTRTTILNRIKRGELKAGVEVRGGILIFTIDPNTYPISDQLIERRGRPRKPKRKKGPKGRPKGIAGKTPQNSGVNKIVNNSL